MIGVTVFCVTALPAASSTIAPLMHDLEPSELSNSMQLQKTHMLVLKCMTDDFKVRQSRIAVLDVGREGQWRRHDAALVSGHGLQAPEGGISENCFVQDFEGSTEPVVIKRLAPNYTPGKAADWGVITFKRVKTPNLIRYSLRSMPWSKFSAVGHEVQFAQARGLPENSQSCNLLERKYAGFTGDGFEGVFAHTCRAISGQSGAPLSLRYGGANVLVGIHLGHSWMLRAPVTGRPTNQAYMRALDDKMIGQIHTILDEIK